MDEDIDFAVVSLNSCSGFLNGVTVEPSITFVVFDFVDLTDIALIILFFSYTSPNPRKI